MSVYGFEKMKLMQMSNGVALTADLYRDGKLVAMIEDQGNGGNLRVMWIEGHWKNPAEEALLLAHYKLVRPEGHWTAEIDPEFKNTEMAVEVLIDIDKAEKLAKKEAKRLASFN
jgi:hypothetical protein